MYKNQQTKFIFWLILIFVIYQGGIFFTKSFFSTLKEKDLHWKITQQAIENGLKKNENLKVQGFQEFVVSPEDETKGRPRKTVEEIFNEAISELNATNQIKTDISKKIDEYYKFTKVNREFTFSNADMDKIEKSIHRLLNIYISEKWPNIYEEDRHQNMKQLKKLVNFHYDLVRIVYDIDRINYKLMFPYLYDFIVSTPEDLNVMFAFENNLKDSKSNYLLTIGGDELSKEYQKETKQKIVPEFIFRNVILLNKYINNISK